MLARWHDASTRIGAVAAALCVAATACIYAAEVVARYFFSAPLNWSGDVSSYLLCACAFMALPMVTRMNGHVAIGYFMERMGGAARVRYARALGIVTGAVCLATAIYIAIEGAELFSQHVLTTQATQIPKWLIALLACFGFGSSALHLFFPRDGSARKDVAV
jgi:TRAP-type C4-dicarboxylate transport system permease small subunit